MSVIHSDWQFKWGNSKAGRFRSCIPQAERPKNW